MLPMNLLLLHLSVKLVTLIVLHVQDLMLLIVLSVLQEKVKKEIYVLLIVEPNTMYKLLIKYKFVNHANLDVLLALLRINVLLVKLGITHLMVNVFMIVYLVNIKKIQETVRIVLVIV